MEPARSFLGDVFDSVVPLHAMTRRVGGVVICFPFGDEALSLKVSFDWRSLRAESRHARRDRRWIKLS